MPDTNRLQKVILQNYPATLAERGISTDFYNEKNKILEYYYATAQFF